MMKKLLVTVGVLSAALVLTAAPAAASPSLNLSPADGSLSTSPSLNSLPDGLLPTGAKWGSLPDGLLSTSGKWGSLPDGLLSTSGGWGFLPADGPLTTGASCNFFPTNNAWH